MRSRQLLLACVLGILLHTCRAEEGVETAVIATQENAKFIAVKDTTATTLWLGVTLSKYYLLVDKTVVTSTPTNLKLYDTDLTTPLPEHVVKQTISVSGLNYGFLKVCPSIPTYTPLTATTVDYLDGTGNDTGTIYYYRLTTTQSFYTKTVSILSDVACAADKALTGNTADAADVAGTNVGCLKWEDCPDTCQQYYDGTDSVIPWVISSTGTPLGNIYVRGCATGTAASTATAFFYKVRGDLAALTTANPGFFDNSFS